MDREQLLKFEEAMYEREQLAEKVGDARQKVALCRLAIGTELNRANGASQKAEDLKEKLKKQKRPMSSRQYAKLNHLNELAGVEEIKKIELAQAEEALAKANEELSAFEEKLMADYEYVGVEDHSNEITPIEELANEAENYESAQDNHLFDEEKLSKALDEYYDRNI